MMISVSNVKNSHCKERGAVLLVSLIMLLLVTVVGTSAIGMATLDTKMTANSRDRQMAFQAAESGLFAAEALLNPDVDLPEVGVTAGFMATALSSMWWDSVATATWWGTNGANVSSYTGQEAPVYIIEQPKVTAADSADQQRNLGVGELMPAMNYYTSTSKGVGPGGATVHLQSVFARKVYTNTP